MVTLNAKTNVPVASSCSVGGDSWVYQLRYDTSEKRPLGVNIVGTAATSKRVGWREMTQQPKTRAAR